MSTFCTFQFFISSRFMNTKIFWLVLTLSGLMTAPAMADQALATSKACMACHGIHKKIVGPAYVDIAKKYGNSKASQAYLVTKIRKGSSQVWGPVPMPANAHVSEEDAQKLAAWVLSLK